MGAFASLRLGRAAAPLLRRPEATAIWMMVTGRDFDTAHPEYRNVRFRQPRYTDWFGESWRQGPERRTGALNIGIASNQGRSQFQGFSGRKEEDAGRRLWTVRGQTLILVHVGNLNFPTGAVQTFPSGVISFLCDRQGTFGAILTLASIIHGRSIRASAELC